MNTQYSGEQVGNDTNEENGGAFQENYPAQLTGHMPQRLPWLWIRHYMLLMTKTMTMK
jgi:hypothetical protein